MTAVNNFWLGALGILVACLFEAKRVPTFPTCLCRHRERSESLITGLSGLQFTSTLGKALELLTKHGLDTERRKEFPMEVAMESMSIGTSAVRIHSTKGWASAKLRSPLSTHVIP